MKEINRITVWIVDRDKFEQKIAHQPMPNWMLFLLYLAWLRAMRPQSHPSVTVLTTLIIAVALVLTVIALVAAGAPEMVAETLRNWPIAP